jgi:transcriptional regulator with XRE-family HTH domain
MKERLLEFLAYLGVGQTKFEEEAGLSRGLINNIKGGISSNTISKITSKYPELNSEWLVSGKGEMLKTTVNQNNVEGDNIQGHNVTVKKTETEKFIDLLQTKDEQMNRLIGIIEKLSK